MTSPYRSCGVATRMIRSINSKKMVAYWICLSMTEGVEKKSAELTVVVTAMSEKNHDRKPPPLVYRLGTCTNRLRVSRRNAITEIAKKTVMNDRAIRTLSKLYGVTWGSSGVSNWVLSLGVILSSSGEGLVGSGGTSLRAMAGFLEMLKAAW